MAKKILKGLRVLDSVDEYVIQAETVTDLTLTQSGVAADAKITGDELRDKADQTDIDNLNNTIDSLRWNTNVITLYKDASWNGLKQQVVNAAGIASDSIVIISPSANMNNTSLYGNAGIICIAQGNETLTFQYSGDSAPTENIQVNILYLK